MERVSLFVKKVVNHPVVAIEIANDKVVTVQEWETEFVSQIIEKDYNCMLKFVKKFAPELVAELKELAKSM